MTQDRPDRPQLPRICLIGMRGIPADLPNAAGGERETEAKAVRLAARGFEVAVYCRRYFNPHPQSPYRGVKLISLPAIKSKHLETPSHTLLATLHAILRNTADVISYHGMGNAMFLPLARLGGKKSVVYMDGIDWERPKWGRLARLVLKLSALVAYRWADVVYVDNEPSQRSFARMFGREPRLITLGADLWDDPGTDLLGQYCLEPEQYLLFVGLLRPDKGVHLLIEAYKALDTPMPLVIVGDNPDEPDYVQKLKTMSDERVKFLGFVYGQAARQLFANCYVYVQPSLMEGNSPALMSAMACRRCVVVNGIDQNRETIGDAGLAFPPGDVGKLRDLLAELLGDPARVQEYGRRARRRIETVYSWDAVVDRLEQVYRDLGRATTN